MEYDCKFEKEIRGLIEDNKLLRTEQGSLSHESHRLVKLIEGNGQKGLFERVVDLTGQMTTLSTSMGKMTDSLDELNAFHAEIIGRDKNEFKSWQKLAILVSAGILILGVILTEVMRHLTTS